MSDYEDVRVHGRGTDRGDHDQPAGALQRLPRPHGRGADQGVPVGLGGPVGAGGDPHRRRREGVLHRRRRQAARRDRRLRAHRERHVRDRLPAQADPGHPQAGDRRGERRRGRRRARAARAVRPDASPRETARFGQAGPKVGSFDAGFGSAYLARVVGEKRAREIWYLCRHVRRGDRRALGPGQHRSCRPTSCSTRPRRGPRRSPRRARPRCASSSSRSTPTPTTRPACRNLAMSALDLFTASPEGLEGAAAFAEKRTPDFAAARRTGTDGDDRPVTGGDDEETMDFALTAEQRDYRRPGARRRRRTAAARLPGAGAGRADRAGAARWRSAGWG